MIDKDSKREILIIPDVHGRQFWKEPLKEGPDQWEKIVFLGDYIDPYPAEGITSEEAIEVLKEIVSLKKLWKDKIVLLMGNHDFGYMPDFYKTGCDPCSRYDYYNAKDIKKIYEEAVVDDLLQLFYRYGQYVFSHAGIMKDWVEKYCGPAVTLDKLLENPEKATPQALWVVSRLRGGYERFGSPLWNDVRDFKNDYPGIYQIFGHTQLRQDPIIEPGFACLDVRRPFILDLGTGEIKELWKL